MRFSRALVLVGVVGALALACTETRRSLGEDCLKNDDCLSGICAQLACASTPVLLDGSSVAPLDAANGADAVVDAGAAADAPAVEASSDARTDG